MSDELADDGSVKKRVLKQVVFILDTQIIYSKYFITNYIFLVDETFKINKLNIVLFIIIKIIITNKNFLTTYNFIKSKIIILFNFFFDNFKYFIFNNNIIKAQIILSN